MVDEALEFDDDVCDFVDRANYYLHTPKSTKSIGMDTEKSQTTKKLPSEKSDDRYRNLSSDLELFDQILTSVQFLLSPESLKQVCLSFDTNLNENTNNVMITYAPKHYHKSSSLSLNTHIANAAEIQIMGHYEFLKLLLDRFHVLMHSNLAEYLNDRDNETLRKQNGTVVVTLN